MYNYINSQGYISTVKNYPGFTTLARSRFSIDSETSMLHASSGTKS